MIETKGFSCSLSWEESKLRSTSDLAIMSMGKALQPLYNAENQYAAFGEKESCDNELQIISKPLKRPPTPA